MGGSQVRGQLFFKAWQAWQAHPETASNRLVVRRRLMAAIAPTVLLQKHFQETAITLP